MLQNTRLGQNESASFGLMTVVTEKALGPRAAFMYEQVQAILEDLATLQPHSTFFRLREWLCGVKPNPLHHYVQHRQHLQTVQ